MFVDNSVRMFLGERTMINNTGIKVDGSCQFKGERRRDLERVSKKKLCTTINESVQIKDIEMDNQI